MNGQRGMTLVELMVSMAIVMIVIAAATGGYLKILRAYKTQGPLSQSYMSNLTGFELLRYDIEMAGFGLPASLPAGPNYTEAATVNVGYNPAALNDLPNAPPRAFAQLENTGNNNSDVLAIKSSAADINAASTQWSMITTNSGAAQVGANNNMTAVDHYIVLDNNGQLLLNGTAFDNTWGTSPIPNPSGLVYYMYGLNTAAITMPFNRVDYYLDAPVNNANPSRCAPGTFTLYRSTISQADGSLVKQPLVDCVENFQVAFGIDPSGNGTQAIRWQKDLNQENVGGNGNTAMTASQIQRYLRDVRVFVLYSEGTGDVSRSAGFRFSGILNLGDQDIASSLDPANYQTTGNNFKQLSNAALTDSSAATPPELNAPGFTPPAADLPYRWKITEIDAKPMNLLNLQAGTLR